MIRTRVLVVEDDESSQERYEFFFQTHQKEFFWVLDETGSQALERLKQYPSPPIDVVLLDWTLPGALDGLDILRFIRSRPGTRFIPVFMVTARDMEKDRIVGFEAGADDYLTKPFSDEELLARLHAVLRRKQWGLEEHKVFEAEDIRLDPKSGQVTVGGKVADLTPTEFGLLLVFMRRPNVIHTQEYLWGAVWSYDSEKWKSTLKEHMSNLRKKLGPKWGERLKSRQDQGYILNILVIRS